MFVATPPWLAIALLGDGGSVGVSGGGMLWTSGHARAAAERRGYRTCPRGGRAPRLQDMPARRQSAAATG